MEQVDIDTILAEVREALASGDWRRAVALVEALRPPDQAEVFGELPPVEQDQLLPRLGVEDSADILEELEEEAAAEVAGRLEADELARILDQMEPDEAADLLGDIPPQHAEDALAVMEEAEEVLPLLVHPDETAGGLMTSAELTLHKGITVAQALSHLRAIGPKTEAVYYLFVVDDEVRLVGVVSLRQLVVSAPSTHISEIMDRDVIYIQADADQEEAARLMSRYDLLALPVVDEETHLLGLITHDDLVDVLEDEATEDIQRFGASEPLEEPYLDAPIARVARKRVGWLLLLFVTGTLTGSVLRLFEHELVEVVTLSVFIPLLIGTGGNAGSQVASTVIRAVALGEVRFRDVAQVVWREVRTAVLLGLVMGLAGVVRALTWHSPMPLAITVGISLIAIVLWSALIGASLPLLAVRLRVDPTVVSGPAMSTLVDATGLVIYFLIARQVMGL